MAARPPRGLRRWPAFGHWLTRDQYLGEDLSAEFGRLFPGRACSALLFPLPVADGDVAAMNRYLAGVVRAEERRYGLMIPPLDASAEELARQVAAGGFLGFKPYWTFAGSDMRQVALDDFVTPAQLAAAHELGLIIMLHPPGSLPRHQHAIRAAAHALSGRHLHPAALRHLLPLRVAGGQQSTA